MNTIKVSFPYPKHGKIVVREYYANSPVPVSVKTFRIGKAVKAGRK